MLIPRVSELDHVRIGCGFSESEFLSEEFLVEIIPNFSSGEPFRLISHESGPFDRRSAVEVPLWIAMYLERQGKCAIKEPRWLSVSFVKQKLREERDKGTASFAVMDDNYIQVAVVLLNRDYLTSEYLGGQVVRDQILSLLAELQMVRKAKILEGLKQINVTTNIVEISDMSSMERSSIRPQSSVIMDTLMEFLNLREPIAFIGSRGN